MIVLMVIRCLSYFNEFYDFFCDFQLLNEEILYFLILQMVFLMFYILITVIECCLMDFKYI